ncbi:helix-turn-helix domain-containing protein [Kitasatospora sp. NPDC053057]|uniref:helix-turn-helix domain-containing protein n=1 Tax=Kitasatospora sp. NPDC053057 TaxID=3364062 RepID=UPI0037CC1A1F
MAMSETTRPTSVGGPPHHDAGDVGRRVALRRERLGLTREELADRAAMAPTYLEYVEERPAEIGMEGLTRLAGVLGTTVADLLGGGVDLPPGTGQAAGRPELLELDQQECRDRLSTHGVGRIALSTRDGPAVFPVNYSVLDGAVVYRTAPHGSLAATAGTEVAFEADHIDEALSQGWSVLVVGRAQRITDPTDVRRLIESAGSEPWAGGERDLWIRIEPERVTGRRISSG